VKTFFFNKVCIFIHLFNFTCMLIYTSIKLFFHCFHQSTNVCYPTKVALKWCDKVIFMSLSLTGVLFLVYISWSISTIINYYCPIIKKKIVYFPHHSFISPIHVIIACLNVTYEKRAILIF